MRHDIQCHKCGYTTPIMDNGDDVQENFRSHINDGLCDKKFKPELVYTARGYSVRREYKNERV